MNRRELIKTITALTGASVIGADLFFTGCKVLNKNIFTEYDISFLDEVAETIIPKTNTPGAKDAETGKFMALYATDCYDETNQKVFIDGIAALNKAAEKKYNTGFISLNATQKQKLLTEIDSEAKKYENQNVSDNESKMAHYFTLMKQLALMGFFTSKPGFTQVLRYNPIPGKYEGCIEYKKGETSWTW